MYKFAFVILHYLGYEDTIECVESIQNNILYSNYEIIIVDNGSYNNSGKIIEEKYKNVNNIHLIKSDLNLGFAKGNNLGYRFAKYSLKADFICLINNDTIISQKNFIDECLNKYNNFNYHVLGPDIVSLVDQGHQNPQKLQGMDKKQVVNAIVKYKIRYVLNSLYIEDLLVKVMKFITRRKASEFISNENWNKQLQDIQLQGCCLIFSPEYISSYEGLYEKTFLYVEEDILFYICRRDSLKTIYDPNIRIYHKEDSATNIHLKNNSRKKRKFIYSHTIDSLNELLKLMKS